MKKSIKYFLQIQYVTNPKKKKENQTTTIKI